jgi:cell wall-associated NlpC family hydrolase
MHKFLKAAVATASGVALTFSVTIATELPANAASSCKQTYNRYNTVKPGSHGTQARSAQCLLHKAGYSVKADGSFSTADSAQLKRFQRATHVNPSGNVYASSWTALLSRGSQPALHIGSRGENVKRLQRALTATGRHLDVDGYYGPITAGAVKSVQRALHVSATGSVNTTVWRYLQTGRPIVVAKPARKPTKKPVTKAPSATGKGAKALAFAKKQLGEKYRWGAAGPNAWDCSGLTMGAWKSVGVSLPHKASQQFHRGRKVSKSDLKPGDLVFFYSGISHVAIYAGGGKVIHAPRPGKSVSYIKMSYMPYKGARRMG